MQRFVPHPYLPSVGHVRVIAHRGFVPEGSSGAGIVENTEAAFIAALDAGAHYLESDCRATSDGHVVLFHDPDLTRVTGSAEQVAQLSLRELSARMVDHGGVLTLNEALEAFPEAKWNIDVKTLEAADGAGRAVQGHHDRVLLTSFSETHRMRALQAATRMHADELQRPATSPGKNGIIKILLALGSRSERATNRAFAGLDALQIPERQSGIRVLTDRLLGEAHRRGVEVHVWTVNDPQHMEKLAARGVDGIVTDLTDVAVHTLR